VGYDHRNTTSTAGVSFALAAHRPCREVGSCLISSATHNGDDQYIDATWPRWGSLQPGCQPANPTRGWLCTARLGPSARNGDGGSAEIESSVQTAIFCSSKGGPPACPLSGAGRSGSPSRRGTHQKASRDLPAAIHRAQHYAD
jgi:hypothetical protein